MSAQSRRRIAFAAARDFVGGLGGTEAPISLRRGESPDAKSETRVVSDEVRTDARAVLAEDQ